MAIINTLQLVNRVNSDIVTNGQRLISASIMNDILSGSAYIIDNLSSSFDNRINNSTPVGFTTTSSFNTYTSSLVNKLSTGFIPFYSGSNTFTSSILFQHINGNILIGTSSLSTVSCSIQSKENIFIYNVINNNGILLNTGSGGNSPSIDFYASSILRTFIRRTSGDGLEFYTSQGSFNPLTLSGDKVLINTQLISTHSLVVNPTTVNTTNIAVGWFRGTVSGANAINSGELLTLGQLQTYTSSLFTKLSPTYIPFYSASNIFTSSNIFQTNAGNILIGTTSETGHRLQVTASINVIGEYYANNQRIIGFGASRIQIDPQGFGTTVGFNLQVSDYIRASTFMVSPNLYAQGTADGPINTAYAGFIFTRSNVIASPIPIGGMYGVWGNPLFDRGLSLAFNVASASDSILNGVSGSEGMRLTFNGNLIINMPYTSETQTGGYKLQVAGRGLFTGSVQGAPATASTEFVTLGQLVSTMSLQQTGSISGSNSSVLTLTGSYDAIFYNYVITSASIKRAGEIMSTWSASSTVYNEISTNTIGGNLTASFSTVISASYIILQVSTPSPSCTIKTSYNLL